MNVHSSLSIAFVLAAAAAAVAQDTRPVAFTNARLVTIAGSTIERGTLVVKNGKIEALGADVAVPPGARVIDASGKTIMPGLVSAYSRAGLQQPGPRMELPQAGGRRGGRGPEVQQQPAGGGAQNRAATKIVDGLYAKQPVFGELLRAGITSLALSPSGAGFPGLGAVLRPDGKTLDALTRDDDAFVGITMVRDGATKKLLKDTFEKAQKVVEERKKPPEKPPAPAAEQKPAEPKPADAKTEPPKGEQPPKPPEPKPQPQPEPPKPEPKPEEKKETPPAGQGPAAGQGQPAARPAPPKDPNVEVLADLLEGKRRAIVQIDSAADVLHWQNAVADGVKFPRAIVVSRHDTLAGTIDLVIDQVKAMQCAVLVPPDLSTLPRSRHLIHPSKQLHDAGVEVGFTLGENQQTLRMLFFRLMELVRYGLPADAALKGVTLVPAKALGIDKRTGSLEAGKDADLLVFRGDPLSPLGQLESVWLGGQEVPQQP